MSGEAEYYEVLERWISVRAQVSQLQDEERALRQSLFNGAFPNPEEGVNKFELSNGGTLKGTHKLNRKPDEEKVAKLPPELLDTVFRVRHDLVMKEYRALTNGDKKKVERTLTITPGLPSLEYVPPKPE